MMYKDHPGQCPHTAGINEGQLCLFVMPTSQKEQCFPDSEISWHRTIAKSKLCSTHRTANVLFLPAKDKKKKKPQKNKNKQQTQQLPPMIWYHKSIFQYQKKAKGQNLRMKNVSPLDGIFLALWKKLHHPYLVLCWSENNFIPDWPGSGTSVRKERIWALEPNGAWFASQLCFLTVAQPLARDQPCGPHLPPSYIGNHSISINENTCEGQTVFGR